MSAAVAAAYGVHRARGTWSRDVDAFVTLDDSGRDIFVRAGLPPEKLHIKPNFIDPFPEAGSGRGGFAFFAGRIAPGKGVETLVQAWTDDLPPLRVAGDGPNMGTARRLAGPNVTFLGRLTPQEVTRHMADAAFQVVPSEFAEPFGRVAIEAMATGTPVLASRAGALGTVVREGVSGIHFDTGNAQDLAVRAREMHRLAPTLRESTRRDAATRFSADTNYEMLMRIYRAAGAEASSNPQVGGPRGPIAPAAGASINIRRESPV